MPHKTLYLIRHAKSSWDHASLRDHDRPLNDRGLHDAAMMGKRFAQQGVTPELIISSSATRARMTAQMIAHEIGYAQDAIIIEPAIYGAARDRLLEIIHDLDDAHSTIILIGHNPDITETVNWLSNAHIDNISTCGVSTLATNSDHWSSFTKGAVKLLSYDYPKRLL
jgi:phosphohistidine phosphatase